MRTIKLILLFPIAMYAVGLMAIARMLDDKGGSNV